MTLCKQREERENELKRKPWGKTWKRKESDTREEVEEEGNVSAFFCLSKLDFFETNPIKQ